MPFWTRRPRAIVHQVVYSTSELIVLTIAQKAVVTFVVAVSGAHNSAATHPVTSTPRPRNETVCYPHVGCFNNLPPFDNAQSVLPHSPEAIGTQFLLYTQENQSQPHIIDHVHARLLHNSGYDPRLLTKFIIHGFTNNIKTKWLYELKDALLKKEKMNVVIVVWGPGAALPDYSQAVANTRVVGMQIKLVIDMMVRQGALVKQMHLIGHSLGAHTSGHVGYLLKPEHSSLGRITGLDPAEPEYLDHPELVRLDKGDADFVDVIHTNGAPLATGGAGMLLACGHVDFYLNGGENQPDCHSTISAAFGHIGDLFTGKFGEFGEAVACSHARAHEVFRESINSQCSFTAYPCDSYEKFQRGECLSCGKSGCGVLGYYSDWYHIRGKLFLNTRDSEPFCGHHYFIEMGIVGDTRGKVEIQLNGTWAVSEWLRVTGDDKQQSLSAGTILSKLVVSQDEVGTIQSVNIRYTKAPWHLMHMSSGKTTLSASYIKIHAGENGRRYKMCIPAPITHQITTKVTQQNHHC